MSVCVYGGRLCAFEIYTHRCCLSVRVCLFWGQMAERLGDWATNPKVDGSISGCEKLRYVPGQGTSPYLPRGNVPVLKIESIRASAK